MERKHLSKSKKTVFLILLLLVIFSALFMLLKSKVEVKSVNFARKEYNLSDEQSTEIGKNAIISSIVVTKRTTGVGPFDTTDEPGNDSSADNNIVRSFDQVAWTMEANMALKSGATHSNFVGGIVEVKAELPENCSNKVKWNISSMNWLEEAVVSEDGRTVTGKYELPTTEVSIPGKREYAFILNVLGAENNLELKPTFTFNLYGNEESEKKELALTKDEDIVKVSAIPKYNIELQKNIYTTRATVDYGDGETEGRMYGISAVLQLLNDNASKGMKGIEIPQGDTSFDINLKLQRSKFGSTELEDITSECTPILWNYKINSPNKDGNIENRIMDFGNITFTYEAFLAPLGIKDDKNRESSIYNSGNVKMEQKENVIKTTINGYEFDGIFPKCGVKYDINNNRKYEDNEGCFSSIYFQIFIPDNEASKQDDKNYYLKIEDTNFNTQSLSNNSITKQEKTTDDTLSITHVRYKKGNYAHKIYTINNKGLKMQDPYTEGNAYINKEDIMFVNSNIDIDPSNDKYEMIKSVDRFLKFNAEAFKPIKVNDKYYELSEKLSTMQFKMYFVTKKDGSNWIDQADMNNGVIENMDLYNSLEEIPNGKLCIGIYFESISGEVINPQDWNALYFRIPLKIKDTAIVNKTYGLVQTSKYWKDKVDRSTFTQENLDSYNDYPKPVFSCEKQNYIKTEYDENGEIIPGTHSGGFTHGQTILIIGAEQKITIKTIDEKEDNKTNYDFGKNEKTVTYQISPRIEGTDSKVGNLSGIKIKITATLPKGLTYIEGSCDYEEPEIIPSENGTTQLVWYKNDCTVNETIAPIKYKTEIDQDSLNSTQYETKVEMKEVVEEGQDYKIGNAQNKFRSANKSINIINLASYTLYKTTETPVIEVNGEVHYKITASNRTENPATEFQLLDILPYKGDGRGTQYSGTYKVNKIEIKQTNLVTGEEIAPNKLNLYVTNDESVRNGITAKDEDLGKTSIWTAATSGDMLNKELKAYSLIGTIESKSKVEIDIYIQTNGNKPNDVYKNAATAQTSKKTELMETSIVKVEDIKREIEGKVWLDKNADGLINEGEKFLPNVKVILLNEDGTPAINIENNEILSKVTDENGYYKFEDMVRGNYKVKVEVTNESQEITSKAIGTDETINSKVNADGFTDTITKLNELSEPVISVKNINAGIKYKETNVVIHHYEEGTTKELSEDITVEGRVEDEYQTESAKDIPEYYELVEVPENATGKMTLNPIEVIYYYRLKNYSYEVNYLEKNTNKVLETRKTVNDIKYGTQINSDNEVIEITGYSYDSCNKENITIGIENNVINLYYIVDESQTKELSYTIEYYKNGELVEEDTERETQEVQVLEPDVLTVKKEKINIGDKYTGYKLEKVEPEAIPDTIENNGVIKVYYIKDNFDYTVEYYYDGVIDESKTEKLNATYQDTITTYTDKVISGYKLERTENVPLIISEYPLLNVIKVYYVKDNYTYTVNYYYDGVIDESKTEKISATFGNKIESYLDKPKEGYEFEKVENIPLIVTEDSTQNIINVYYVRKDATCIVKYVDKNTGEEISEEVRKTGKILDKFDVAEDEKEIPGYTLVERPNPTTGEYTEETQTKIYYYAKNTKVIVKYLKKDETPEDNTDNSILAEEDIIEGYIGKEYITDKKDIDNYTFIESTNNTTGKMTEEAITVIYYYLQNTKVIVNHIDKNSGEKLEVIEESGKVGDVYTSNAKDFEGYVLVEKPENETITMTKDVITLNYYYVKISSGVIEKHINFKTEEILEEKLYEGKEGETYSTSLKEFEEYDVVTNKMYYTEYVKEHPEYLEENEVITVDELLEKKGLNPEGNYIPENHEGIMTVEPIEVKYYYIRKVQVRAEYIDKITGEKIQEVVEETNDRKDSTEIITGHEGNSYKTEEKVFEGYDIVKEQYPENSEGIMEVTTDEKGNVVTEIVVKYYYIHKAKVIEKHIDIKTEELLEKETVYEGHEGEEYNTKEKEFEGYDIVKEQYPKNNKGKMTKETIEVKYYYIRKADVVVEYIDKITGEKLIETDKETNAEIDSTEKIKGHEGDSYKTEEKVFEDYVIIKEEYPDNSEGTMKVIVNDDGAVNTTTYVRYYYVHVSSGVIEKHIDVITGELLEDETRHEGNEGDLYSIKSKEFEGYDLVKEKLPKNAEGKMAKEEIDVKYYYIRKAKVIVRYLEKDTNKVLAKEETIEGHEGDKYDTERKEIEGYNLVEVPKNKTGKMERKDIIVTYYYNKKAEQSKPTTPSKSDTPTTPSNTQNKPQQVIQITEEKQTTQNNKVIPTAQNTTQVKTGDIVPVITICIIILVFILNILQVLIFRKRKNTN